MAGPSPSVAALGYVAASLTTLSFFPQAIKTLRSGDTSAISLRMYVLFTSGIALWGLYGLLTGDGPLIIANAITLVSAGNHRLAIFGTGLFFVLGLLLLRKVNVNRGIASAGAPAT